MRHYLTCLFFTVLCSSLMYTAHASVTKKRKFEEEKREEIKLDSFSALRALPFQPKKGSRNGFNLLIESCIVYLKGRVFLSYPFSYVDPKAVIIQLSKNQEIKCFDESFKKNISSLMSDFFMGKFAEKYTSNEGSIIKEDNILKKIKGGVIDEVTLRTIVIFMVSLAAFKDPEYVYGNPYLNSLFEKARELHKNNSMYIFWNFNTHDPFITGTEGTRPLKEFLSELKTDKPQ